MSTPAYVEEWESGAWNVTVEKNCVDGYPRDVVLSTHATVRFSNTEGDSDDPVTMASLFLRYRDNATELFIHWGGDEFFYGESTYVGHSIDGSDPSVMAWNNSSSAEYVFYPVDEFPLNIFINRLVNAGVLWVAADIGNGAMLNAWFELEGLEQAIAPLRDAGGFWTVDIYTDPFNDSRVATLYTFANDQEDFDVPIMLGLRSGYDGNKYEVFIFWNVKLVGFGAPRGMEVQHRIDRRPSEKSEWVIAADYESTAYDGNARSLVRMMANGERFLARVIPHRSYPITAEFDLRGLARVVHLLR